MSEAPQPSGYLTDPPLTTRERAVREMAVEGLQLGDSKLAHINSLNAYRDTLVAIVTKLRGSPA